MFDFCKPRKKKIVWYPKHRYYDELGLYDKKKTGERYETFANAERRGLG